MISVEEALRAVLAQVRPLETVRVPLHEACDRVLAENVVAALSVPPFDNAGMDGYAVRQADLVGASELDPVPLRVVSESAAGDGCISMVAPGTAVRVMTGAPLPEGADAVVMQEETRRQADRLEVLVRPQPDENVRRAGEDVAAGSVVFRSGAVLTPAALGVLASLGRSTALVHRRPRVAILGTGNELVPLGQPLGPGQIHDSSAVALEALVAQMGAEPIRLGIARDEPDELRARLLEATRADVLLTTGGTSVGESDMLKAVLSELGELQLWKVNMQPGKPLAFGRVQDTLVFGLPGNPVSSLVAFEVFVRPALRRLQGHAVLEKPRFEATLLEPIHKQIDRRQYVRAVVDCEGGSMMLMLAGLQGTHMLTSLARANALAILPEGQRHYMPGDKLSFIFLEGGPYACRHPDAQ